MLKVIDDGVVVTLNGKDKNPLLVMSAVLVVLAIGVAIIAMTQAVMVAIGALAVFAVFIFIFNIYKNNLKHHGFISSGQLTVKRQEFRGGTHVVKLSENAKIDIANQILIVKDLGRVWQLSGFESEKELMVVKSVLEGQALQKKECAIRLM